MVKYLTRTNAFYTTLSKIVSKCYVQTITLPSTII